MTLALQSHPSFTYRSLSHLSSLSIRQAHTINGQGEFFNTAVSDKQLGTGMFTSDGILMSMPETTGAAGELRLSFEKMLGTVAECLCGSRCTKLAQIGPS